MFALAKFLTAEIQLSEHLFAFHAKNGASTKYWAFNTKISSGEKLQIHLFPGLWSLVATSIDPVGRKGDRTKSRRSAMQIGIL